MNKYIMLFLSFFATTAYAEDIDNFHYVGNGIYRSGLLTALNIDNLKAYNIKTIISLKTDSQAVAIEREWASKNKVIFFNIPINIALYNDYNKRKFRDVYALMKILPRPLLVHCSRGSDRTGIAIAQWQILSEQRALRSALHEMDYYGFSPLFSIWKLYLSEVFYGSSDYTNDYCHRGANRNRVGKRTDSCYHKGD